MFNYSLGSYQLIQYKFSDTVTEISIVLQRVLKVARLIDNNLVNSTQISFIKRNSTIKALNIARNCCDILGGNGIIDEYRIMRQSYN